MHTVLYYTSPYFLDISLEVINTIKKHVALHVLVEVTPNSKKANLLNIDGMPVGKALVTPEEVLNPEQRQQFAEYFEGCQSVHFIQYGVWGNNISDISKTGRYVKKLIRELKPSVIHFESFSIRTIPLLPLLFSGQKIVFSIHDGQLHSGEKNWKDRLARFLFLRLSRKKAFVFYSRFTQNQFFKNFGLTSAKTQTLTIDRYTFWSKLKVRSSLPKGYILFFGRISVYKGVPALLDAMPKVWEKFPQNHLVIAGKGNVQEVTNHALIMNRDSRVRFINRYIPNDELANLIGNSAMTICPYKEASQSGVLWTSFGLCKPVVATRVGAFAEFIKPGFNGILADDASAESIADAIIDCLSENKFLDFERNLRGCPAAQCQITNGEKLLNLYRSF